jgi:FkbM family methyltransferase
VRPAIGDMTVSVVNRVPGSIAAPFRSGRLLARAAGPLLERLLPTDLTEVSVRSGPLQGVRLLIDPQREKYYWTGRYERAVQDAFEALVRPGDVVWDIGAHIGFFSLLASRLVGDSGCVVAFEPVKENRLRLERNVSLNEAHNVAVRSEAVGGESGAAVLHARSSSSMWTLRHGRASPASRVVPCTTLDDIVRSTCPPTLIKVDAEDVELDVLRGARRLLSEHRPTVVIELHSSVVSDCLAIATSHQAYRLEGAHWVLEPTHSTEFQKRPAVNSNK